MCDLENLAKIENFSALDHKIEYQYIQCGPEFSVNLASRLMKTLNPRPRESK